jgi:hypothetical protein
MWEQWRGAASRDAAEGGGGASGGLREPGSDEAQPPVGLLHNDNSGGAGRLAAREAAAAEAQALPSLLQGAALRAALGSQPPVKVRRTVGGERVGYFARGAALGHTSNGR